MKKRKAPIVLLSLLAVLIGGAIVVGMSSGEQKPADAPDKLTQEHDAPTQAEVAQKVDSAAKPMKPPAMKPGLMPDDKGPSISVKSNETNYPKPVPSGPTTSSQWYNH